MGGMDSRQTTLRYSPTSLLLIVCLSIIRPDTSPAAQTKIWEELSGEKALAHVERLVDFGPRPPGSEAIEKSRHYIEDQLRRSGWRVKRQAFTDNTPRGKVQFVNLTAQFPGQGNAAPLFLLCSHYDTKTFDAIKFVGANDAGSSTGLLLELARVIGQHPNLAVKIELVFFDGEEAYRPFFGDGWLVRKPVFCQTTPRQQRQTVPRRDLVRHGWRSFPRHHASCRFASRNSARHLCGSGSAQAEKLFHVP